MSGCRGPSHKKKGTSLVDGGSESREQRAERQREREEVYTNFRLFKNAGEKIGVAHKGTCWRKRRHSTRAAEVDIWRETNVCPPPLLSFRSFLLCFALLALLCLWVKMKIYELSGGEEKTKRKERRGYVLRAGQTDGDGQPEEKRKEKKNQDKGANQITVYLWVRDEQGGR